MLLHDLHRNTAEALPALRRELKDGGYKIVHVVPKAELATIPKCDDLFKARRRLSSSGTRYEKNLFRTAVQ